MKMNPVYKKELKTSVRSVKTAVLLMGYNGILALFGLFAFYITFEYQNKYGGTVDYSEILQIYAIITATEFGLVLFTVPALTAGCISGERERQTLDILLTTKITPLQIILGKLESSISMMILFAVSSIPVLALVFSIGGISVVDLLEFMVLIIVTAVFVGSIGIFFSALFKKTTASTVSTYGILLAIIAGTVLGLYAITMVMEISMNKATDLHLNPDLGNGVLILLVNPAVTCFAMIEEQIGTGSRLASFFHNFGTISIRMQNSWFVYSIIIQLCISFILLWCSSRFLNPLKRERHKRKRNK